MEILKADRSRNVFKWRVEPLTYMVSSLVVDITKTS